MPVPSRPILPAHLMLLATALGACTSPQLGQRSSAVVNGVLDAGHPAVGCLYFDSYVDCACTASLVGTRTVLTAAHCVTDEEKPPYTICSDMSFVLGAASGAQHAIDSVVIHPDYDATSVTNDLAVVRLASPIAGVTPHRLATTAPQVGELVTIVGYGQTTLTDVPIPAEKRKATNTIGLVEAVTFTYYGATGAVGNLGYGDSGGPDLSTDGEELVVGVHSTGLGTGPKGPEGNSVRVDVYQEWIAQQAQGNLWTPPLPPEGPRSDAAPARVDGPGRVDGPPPSRDAAVSEAPPASSGCSVGGAGAGLPGLVLLALLLVLRRR